MKLFYDTETTGLPDWKSPSGAEHQPHMVEIGAALTDDDLNVVEQYQAIIKPEGWEISEAMTAIHGISHERAMDEGVNEKEAVEAFLALHDKSILRIGHNVSFDDRIMRIAFKRYLNDDAAEAFKAAPKLCTMWESKQIVKAPFKDKKGVKNPNLAEAYKFFTGEDIADAHRAMGDVLSTIAVYKGLEAWKVANEA